MKTLSLFLLSTVFLGPIHAQTEKLELPKKISFATTSWCPYICDSKSQPGFAVEFIQQIFKNINVPMKYKILPWSRAINMVQKQDSYDGLLTAVKSEAEGLVLTNAPSFQYKACFYGKKTSSFKFKKLSSLDNFKVGAISGYGYSEKLDSHFASRPKNILFISDSQGTQRLIKLYLSGRIDLFIGDQNVVRHASKKIPQVAELDCLEESNVFMAFHPKTPNLKNLLKKLNEELSKEENKKLFEKLSNRYISEKRFQKKYPYLANTYRR